MKPASQRAVRVAEIGAGANMAFRREVRSLVGLFDERLDVGAAGCNGDSEYWYRILAEGWQCRYEPTAVVHHYHRREMDGLNRQLFYYMRGHAAALLVQYERYGHAGNLHQLLCVLPGYYCRTVLSLLRMRSRLRLRTIGAEILGYLSGIEFYLLNRRRKSKLDGVQR